MKCKKAVLSVVLIILSIDLIGLWFVLALTCLCMLSSSSCLNSYTSQTLATGAVLAGKISGVMAPERERERESWGHAQNIFLTTPFFSKKTPF